MGALKIVAAILFVCICQSFTIGAQYTAIPRTVSEDYISSEYHTIFQDKYGYLWFGTRGLIKFDGYESVDLRYNPNDLNWATFHIAERPSGDLVVATSPKLYVYERRTSLLRPHESPSEYRKSWIESLVIDSVGTEWYGTHDRGLFTYNVEHDSIVTFRYDDQDPQVGVGVWNTMM